MSKEIKIATTQRNKARRIAREANRQRRCAEVRAAADPKRAIWRHRGQDICRLIRRAAR